MSRALGQLLDAAQREAERLKDEYVSVEHLVLAMIDSSKSTPAAACWSSTGPTATASSRP